MLEALQAYSNAPLTAGPKTYHIVRQQFTDMHKLVQWLAGVPYMWTGFAERAFTFASREDAQKMLDDHKAEFDAYTDGKAFEGGCVVVEMDNTRWSDPAKTPAVMRTAPNPSVVGSRAGLVEHEPGYFIGTLEIGGADHHFEFIRVYTDEADGMQKPWHPPKGEEDNQNEERYEALQALYDGCYETMQIPGIEGDFVCWVVPYAT